MMQDEKAVTYIKVYITGYTSCKDVHNHNASLQTGVYDLEAGKHFCYMDTLAGACGKGGWTLALKVNGTKVNSNYVLFHSLLMKILIKNRRISEYASSLLLFTCFPIGHWRAQNIVKFFHITYAPESLFYIFKSTNLNKHTISIDTFGS